MPRPVELAAPVFALHADIIERDPVTVACLRHVGPYGWPLEKFWTRQVIPRLTTLDLLDRVRFGLGLDDPLLTPTHQCRYDACVACTRDEHWGESWVHTVIPGGRYAAFAFRGTGLDIGGAWDALLRDWLPKSGLRLDSRPMFEHYPATGRYDAQSGVFDCQLCVPVRQ